MCDREVPSPLYSSKTVQLEKAHSYSVGKGHEISERSDKVRDRGNGNEQSMRWKHAMKEAGDPGWFHH